MKPVYVRYPQLFFLILCLVSPSNVLAEDRCSSCEVLIAGGVWAKKSSTLNESEKNVYKDNLCQFNYSEMETILSEASSGGGSVSFLDLISLGGSGRATTDKKDHAKFKSEYCRTINEKTAHDKFNAEIRTKADPELLLSFNKCIERCALPGTHLQCWEEMWGKQVLLRMIYQPVGKKLAPAVVSETVRLPDGVKNQKGKDSTVLVAIGHSIPAGLNVFHLDRANHPDMFAVSISTDQGDGDWRVPATTGATIVDPTLVKINVLNSNIDGSVSAPDVDTVVLNGNGLLYTDFHDSYVSGITMQAWIKTTKRNQVIMSDGGGSSYASGIGIWIENGTVNAYGGDKGVEVFTIIGPAFTKDGDFHHVALTWTGGQEPDGVTLYIDGIKVSGKAKNPLLRSSDLLGVGGHPRLGYDKFKGVISKAEVYRRVLSQNEIEKSVAPVLGTQATQ